MNACCWSGRAEAIICNTSSGTSACCCCGSCGIAAIAWTLVATVGGVGGDVRTLRSASGVDMFVDMLPSARISGY